MNTAAHIVEVSMTNFQEAVVEKSNQVPVLIEFYAEGAEPCEQLAPVLRRLAEQYQGKFILGRVNIQENPQLVQQLGVRTLPTLKLIIQGKIAQDLEGPQEEDQLRVLLDQVTVSPVERIREQIDLLIAGGDRQGAITILQQMIAEEPKNFGLHTELCDLLIMVDRIDEARQILEALPNDAEGINKPQHRLEFMDLARGLPRLKKLRAAVEKNGTDLKARFDLAVSLVADDRMEEGLEQLLAMLKQDRSHDDEVARRTMVKVFDLLGRGNPLATEYRRKMFSFLH